MRKFNKILVIISWGVFIVGLLRIIISFDSLPYEIGVHFSPNGQFDVFTNKKDLLLIGYPFLMSFTILLISQVVMLLLYKMKVGFKIKKKGEFELKDSIKLMINISNIFYVIYLSLIWGNCIIRQIDLNADFMFYFVSLYLLLMFGCFILIYKVIKKYSLKREGLK